MLETMALTTSSLPIGTLSPIGEVAKRMLAVVLRQDGSVTQHLADKACVGAFA